MVSDGGFSVVLRVFPGRQTEKFIGCRRLGYGKFLTVGKRAFVGVVDLGFPVNVFGGVRCIRRLGWKKKMSWA